MLPLDSNINLWFCIINVYGFTATIKQENNIKSIKYCHKTNKNYVYPKVHNTVYDAFSFRSLRNEIISDDCILARAYQIIVIFLLPKVVGDSAIANPGGCTSPSYFNS
jgi:hypothetical protein